MTSLQLQAAEKPRLRLGYVRLTDSAPILLAQEYGLFERYGLEVELSQEGSWANVRDKLTAGHLDAAQMLAPLPVMTTAGASGLRVPMLSGLTLSLNGNAITLSSSLWEAVRPLGAPQGARQAARALKALIARGRQPTFGVVHAFSTHMILLRAWLRAGDIDPDRDVRTIVVPPAQMVDSLSSGIIDGYCVGEPWNSLAVHYGLGAIAAVGPEVWRNAPEKVLAVTEGWHAQHRSTHLRLRLALMEASAALVDPQQRRAAADVLSRPEYLDLPASRLLPSLTGELVREPGGEPVPIEDFHVFSAGLAGFPWRSNTEFLLERGAELLGTGFDAAKRAELSQQTARPDLFREAAGYLGLAVPETDRMPAISMADRDVLSADGVEVRATALLS